MTYTRSSKVPRKRPFFVASYSASHVSSPFASCFDRGQSWRRQLVRQHDATASSRDVRRTARLWILLPMFRYGPEISVFLLAIEFSREHGWLLTKCRDSATRSRNSESRWSRRVRVRNVARESLRSRTKKPKHGWFSAFRVDTEDVEEDSI